MAERKAPGERLSARLASRRSEELHRSTGPDGGEVYSGGLATRALRAIGARAMTMDNTMFVADDFDAADPQDQAIYAHEQVHMEGSGGSDTHVERDAEEVAARAIERMVLHRASAGEDFGSIMRDITSQGIQRAADASPEPPGEEDGGNTAEAAAAYQALLDQGKSHAQIVRDLSRFVINSLAEQEEKTKLRSTEAETF